MTEEPRISRDPLHGVTLATIVEYLVKRYGWAVMAERIPVRCFMFEPSVKSSLTFLRRTPWAREKIEAWYVADMRRGTPSNPWEGWQGKPDS